MESFATKVTGEKTLTFIAKLSILDVGGGPSKASTDYNKKAVDSESLRIFGIQSV